MIKNKKIKKNQKGFTLVEVIVVAVIVAVLAAVAIPLYLNYVTDASMNTARNTAAAAATFLSAAQSGCQDYVAPANGDKAELTVWEFTSNGATAGTKDIKYTVPKGATLTITGNTVKCKIRTQTSDPIPF